MRQTRQLWIVHPIEKSSNVYRVWHLSLILSLGMLGAIAASMNAEIWEPGTGEELQLGPIENPSSPLPARGYKSRPCGFDLNHNGIIGEAADCNVCDASLVSGKIVANTVDPDGDGIEEDLIYVDCDGGSNFNYCGRPGFRPCGTIEYAWDTIADGPEDGAEDIVCFTGTCTPDTYRFPDAYNGIPGHWTKPKTGSETRDWQFPQNPAMLVGWDTDDDGKYPPFDADDTSVLDGTGLKWAFKLNTLNANSYYEMAHLVAHDYGDHTPNTDGGGGFVNMFAVTRETSHGHLHDLSLRGINKDAASYSPRITFSWFNSGHSSYVALTNIESLDDGPYTFRGSASLTGEVIAGPWRFQNLTITAHGCDEKVCEGRSGTNPWKFWGWVDGIEILDSVIDGNLAAWSPYRLTGIVIDANTRDWDIINNEIIDWGVGIFAVGKIPEAYSPVDRYTDDIVISRNLIHNAKRDRTISVWIDQSGGNNQAVSNVWILNNIMASSLLPKVHVLIRQGNTDGPCVTNVRVFNNTFYGRADDSIRVVDVGASYRFERLRFKNNIIAGQSPKGTNLDLAYLPTFWDSDFNIVDSRASLVLQGVETTSMADWRALTGGDTHSRSCQVAFKSPPFNLGLSSSDLCAKDKADAFPYLTSIDFESETRPYGPRWDIGADEWNGGFFWDSMETGSLSRWSDSVP